MKIASPSTELRFPEVDPRGEAPNLKPQEDVWSKAVRKRVSGEQVRALAPGLWKHMLQKCRTQAPRSHGQRGRWSEYRTHWVLGRIAKASQPRLTPPALAAGLLQVAEANEIREPQLEAVCGLLALRQDETQS